MTTVDVQSLVSPMTVQLTVTGSLNTLNSTKVPSRRIICNPGGTAAGCIASI